jgi:mevalonate kinase
MKVLSSRSFPAKILLFGEYSILFNSKAIVLPLKEYTGRLAIKDTLKAQETGSHRELWSLYSYLLDSDLKCLNLDKYREDLQNGLWFDSNIPQGQGIGSSGAVTAAVFHQYCDKDIKKEVINGNFQLGKQILGVIESHFHNKSSGLDPLSSLLQKPLYVDEDNILPIKLKGDLDILNVFLVNTKKQRQVRKIMQRFMELCEDADFIHKIKNDYLDINNLCVDSFIQKDKQSLGRGLERLSYFQLENFKDFIPEHMVDDWKSSLQNEQGFFKLCGAGGGGHLLKLSLN